LADLATVQADLAEARRKYHQLMTGTLAVVVRNAAGRYLQYALPQAPLLKAYIAELEAQEAVLLGAATLARRPIRVSF